jgi:hypothetical protein
MIPRSGVLAVLVGSAVPLPLAAQNTVRFTPTVGYPTFAVREPVLRVNPNIRARLEDEFRRPTTLSAPFRGASPSGPNQLRWRAER